jgi:hypothetical protein
VDDERELVATDNERKYRAALAELRRARKKIEKAKREAKRVIEKPAAELADALLPPIELKKW